MQRVLLVLLLFAIGCGTRPEVDPRDRESVEEYFDRCDRSNPRAYLVVENQSTFRVRLSIGSQSGGTWPLTPTIHGLTKRTVIRVPRQILETRGVIHLELLSGGLIIMPPRPVPLTSLMCDTGTLIITPSPSMSSYFGADFG